MHRPHRLVRLLVLCAGLAALDAQAQPADAATFTLDRNGFEASSADGAFTFAAGARLHADFAAHRGDSATGVDAVDGTEIRRARLELDGTFQGDWGWAAHLDFAGNDVSIKDFLLEFSGLERVSLSVGHQKQPYSLALEMSSNDIPFMERSIDNDLIAPFVDRAVGVRAETSGERWFAAAGLFGEPIDSSGGDDGWGTAGRFVYAPTVEDDRVLHLGFRAAYREPADGGVVRIRDETTPFSDLHVVDTGVLGDVRSVTLLGPEVAFVRGRWSVGGEYNDAQLDRDTLSDLGFDSWHVAATYSLGGESRASAYRLDAGELKRLEPTRRLDLGTDGRGTWELTARYASLDLNDGAAIGGRERALTAGANWYANDNVRVLLSWTRILDTDGSTPLRAGAEGIDVVTARVQLTF